MRSCYSAAIICSLIIVTAGRQEDWPKDLLAPVTAPLFPPVIVVRRRTPLSQSGASLSGGFLATGICPNRQQHVLATARIHDDDNVSRWQEYFSLVLDSGMENDCDQNLLDLFTFTSRKPPEPPVNCCSVRWDYTIKPHFLHPLVVSCQSS